MTTSPISQILVRQDERVLYINFNRPERKNALSLAMYSALADVITTANEDASVRVLVLGGTDDFFTSGNDLLDFMNEPTIHDNHPVVRFMRALQYSAKPVVAVVRGHAVGIGTTMLLHCDLVYAAKDARLQLPFVSLGLCPEYASSYLLPMLVGHQKASELLLLGDFFSGAQAALLGLINEAVESTELEEHALARIKKLANQPPAAVKRTKALLKQHSKITLDAVLQAEFLGFAEGLNSEECKESVTAFFEKRAPDFSKF